MANSTFDLQTITNDSDYSEGQEVSNGDSTCVENAGIPGTVANAGLSDAHRKYLLERHGTLELNPTPCMDPADPYNWPQWKKTINLVLVAFHSCMGTFTAACIIPAYADIAANFGVTITDSSYLTSLQIALLGVAPLFWRPLSTRYGSRPIFLLSLIYSMVFNIACAKCTTYGALAGCRALVAFFISPASAIGPAVVTETTFQHDRAKFMGVWTLMVTLGVPIGPLVFGAVTKHIGYIWIFWILAITNAVQLVLYLFFGPETRYIDTGYVDNRTDGYPSAFKREYLSLRRIDPSPMTWFEFIHPLTMGCLPAAVIPACSYAMVFLLGIILETVEVPTLLQKKFDLNAEQLGLQFLGIMVGSLIGELLGGDLSDRWMRRRQRAEPEFRLWLSYPGFAFTIIGMIVFMVFTQISASGHWSVSPIIGTGIAAAGNQLVTTVLITYAIDCYPQEASSVGVFITLVRQIWGFIGPFWFPYMFDNVGIARSAGITTAMLLIVSVIPMIFLHWRGQILRRPQDST